MAIEVGKNRLEALGDVEETADLIRYYCDQMEENDGFDHPMGNLGDAAVHTRSVLKPHGVWAIISPFNFPFALAGGPSGGGARHRQHGRLQAQSATRRSWRCKLYEILRRGRPADRRLQLSSPARARRSAPSCTRTRTSTASSSPAASRSASRSTRTSRTRYPEAGHRRDGRQEPDDRQPHRRPGRGGRRRDARRVRLRRPEVLRQQPRLRGARGARRVRRAASPSKTASRSASATRPTARTGSGPIINQRRSRATRTRSARRSRDGQAASPAASA